MSPNVPTFRPTDDPRAGWTLETLPDSKRIGHDGLIVLERLDDAWATRDEGVAKRQMAHLFIMKGVPGAPLWLQVGLGHYLSKFRVHHWGGYWQACFGTPEWPDDRPVPQASVEFEVGDPGAVQAAAGELRAGGFTLLHDARTEPWGQTVARLQSPEGTVVGISFAPWMHDGT